MTAKHTLRGADHGPGGYRRLVDGPGEAHQVRTELAARTGELGQPLLTVAHLSDIHICDAQSPARAEFLDRWADPDSPIRDLLEEVGTYRAHEMLTAQVAEAMVQSVNAVEVGPIGRAPLDLAIATGDNTDNAQANELEWYLALLEGGVVRPDSGDLTRYEGVADGELFDERFWHPETAEADLPRSRYGFPYVPGLLAAARAPFTATGLNVPWLAVHGNHDQMLQGTIPAVGAAAAASTGAVKPIGLPPEWSTDAVLKFIIGLNDCDPAALDAFADVRVRIITPDPARRVYSRTEFVAAHRGPRARPVGHGFGVDGRPYYRYDHGPVSVLVLDTVNEHGGWQGSLDVEQVGWVQAELESADAEHRYVVLASHHPLSTMVNDASSPGSGPRVLAAEFDAVLAGHPSLVLWLNGHTHETAVTPHETWWEVTAPSLIDWPQQARVVELLSGPDSLTVAATMLDHAGPAPWGGDTDGPLPLAGLSRELAANDWQWLGNMETHVRSGTAADRNVLLPLPDPWA